MLTATPAYAAPGDPFPAADPLVFVAQQQPTQLYQATTNASGVVQFVAEGPAAPVTYNAISYNQGDNYLYGITAGPGSVAFPTGSLVKIGQGGVLSRVGTGLATPGVQNVGGFGDDGYLYTTTSGSIGAYVTNTTTGANVRTITFSQTTNVSDWTSADGFLWGISDGAGSGPLVVRTNPVTGTVTKFPAPAGITAESAFGAAWTFGNGNLGFSANDSGTVYQIAVANPAGTPAFTLVATSSGPASSANDGAASAGLPTDLAIVKTGPAALPPAGGTVSYTITVTNNGPGDSSGYVVNDTVPAPLTSVASADPACTITGNAVRCLGGALANGDTATFTVTATVPAGVTSVVDNTATVTSNENDPTPGNNTSTTTAAPTSISILKNAGTPVDVNANGLTDAGDTIQYTFDVTNTGQVPLTAITVTDPKVGAVTCAPATLAIGATVTCAAATVYTITAADVTSGSVDNSATATGTTPDGNPITSAPSVTTTPTTAPAPAITIVKSASPSDSASYVLGAEITYSFVVTNTGNVPLNDVTVVEGPFTGAGTLSAITCPSTTLAVGAQQICDATYTLTQADVDAESVTNSATAEGTPPGSIVPTPSTPSNVTIPTPAAPSIAIVKTADVATITAAGQDITYSFQITNTGNVTLTDVAVDEGAFNGSGNISVAVCPTTTLIPGQNVLCTASYTVTQADIDAGAQLTNTATGTGTTPAGDPVGSTPSTSIVPLVQTPALTVVKSADVVAAETGQTVTFSFLVTNTGNVTVTDPTINEVAFSGTGPLSAIICPADDTLAPGEDVTCTATYILTQADADSGGLTNTATVTGTTPDGDPTGPATPSTAIVVTDPLPALSVVKTADVQRVTAVGQVVTYSFAVTNIGNVTITNPTVNEGAFNGHGALSTVTCPASAATLQPGVAVTCTATYTVVAADLADGGNLVNTATVSGTTPDGTPVTSTPSSATVDEVTPPAAPSLLAMTGSTLVAPASAIAALLLMLGAAFLLLRRNRHRG